MGNAFTTVFAGFAFTTTVLPNISRLPAFVAGFTRVLIMHTPGTMNLPFFTSAAATEARLFKTFMQSDFLTSVSAASASAMPPLVMLFTAAFFVGAILQEEVRMRGQRTVV